MVQIFLVGVGGQMEQNLMRIATGATGGNGGLLAPAAGWRDVDGDLLGAGAADGAAQVEDNFRAAVASRARSGLSESAAGTASAAGLLFRRAAECRESLLGAGQVSSVQSLPNRLEILLALAD